MKLSVYNPTGTRVAIHGNGRFAGIVVRSLFATRGHQLFDVASQEHADWLIKHINVTCPAAQVTVIGDEPEIVAPAAIEPTESIQGITPVVQEDVAPVVTEEVKKTGSKKSKTVTETKE